MLDHEVRAEFERLGGHTWFDDRDGIGKHVLHPVLRAVRRRRQRGRQHADVVRGTRPEHHAVRRELHRFVVAIGCDVLDFEKDGHVRPPGQCCENWLSRTDAFARAVERQ